MLINSIVLSDSLYWENSGYVNLSGRKYTAVGRVIDSLVAIDLFNQADNLLTLEPEFEYTILRYGLRLRVGNHSGARSFLNTILTENELETDFVNVQNIHLDFLQDTAFVIDSVVIADLEIIADKRSVPASHARALLSLFDLRNWKPIFAQVPEEFDPARRINTEALGEKEVNSVVYPNPGSGQFTIFVSEKKFSTNEHILITIYSSTGQSLFKKELQPNNYNEVQLNLDNYPNGLYFIDLSQKGTISEHLKVVKQ